MGLRVEQRMRWLMLAATVVLVLSGCTSIQRSEENPHPRLADSATGDAVRPDAGDLRG